MLPETSFVQRQMILIHGAWQGSWAWDRLQPYLRLRGWRTHAIDLPGNGSDETPAARVSLNLYVDHVARLLDSLGEQAVVVAHSGGGIVASQLAEARPNQVAATVYIAGIMLPDGVGFASLVREISDKHPESLGIGPYLQWSSDRMISRVPASAARNIFFHDCPETLADLAIGRLTPQPEGGRAVSPRLSRENYGRVPRVYIEAARDRSVIPRLQRRMLALSPGTRHFSIDSGHVPQLGQPDLLAQLISDALGSHDGRVREAFEQSRKTAAPNSRP
jgi:pimeloyl-ACP methyl ester carboxylesterase